MKTTIETSQIIAKVTPEIEKRLWAAGLRLSGSPNYVGVDEEGNYTLYYPEEHDVKDRLSSEKEFLNVLEGRK